MRKITFALNISLDGCCEHTLGMPDDELYAYYTQFIREVDVFVYGRKTFELMVPYWPDMAKDHSGDDSENEYADAFAAVKKTVVFSKTLQTADNEKTEIVHGNLEETIRALKQEQGKNIAVGGIDLGSQLMDLDLIDEFHFVVHPVIVGKGRRLFEGINLQRLKLVGSKTFASGCIALHYAKQQVPVE